MIEKNEKLIDISIVISSSDEYSIYIPVLLNALKINSNQEYKYNIYVLDSGISKSSQMVISDYVNSLNNFFIKYIDVNYYVEKYKDLWYICAHFSVATYIRFFIPELIPDLNKVLYLDLDLYVKGDVSELFNIDIGENTVGAAVDACYERETYYDKNNLVDYNKNIVCYPIDYKVFNAGVLLVNLKKWRELNITEKFISRLREIKTPRVLDQCILNSVFCNGLVYDLPAQWNYQWHADVESIPYPTISQKMNEVIDAYRTAKHQIKIIHYTTPTKPWNIYCKAPSSPDYYSLETEFSSLWWEHARNTPFYEKIIMLNILKLEENLKKLDPPNLFNYLNNSSNNKKYLLGLIKVNKNGGTKRFYLLGIRLFKTIKNNEFKYFYLLNLLIYKKKIK